MSRPCAPGGTWAAIATARVRPLAAAVALALACIVLASTAAPAGATPGGTPDRQAAAVELVEQPARVGPGEAFDVRVNLSGLPADAELDMVVYDRLESRGAFRETLDGELGGEAYVLPPQPVASLSGGPGGTVGVSFTPSDTVIGGSRGVYPVEVRALSAGGEVLGRVVTYLTYLHEEPPGPPLNVAVLVDIAATPSLQPDGTRQLPAGAVERAVERTEVLSDTPGVPLTLAPLPETIEGLVAGGPTAAAVVEDLRTIAADRPVLARPFVTTDLAALQSAGLIGEANELADGGANVVRTRLGVEPAGGMWLAGTTYGDEAARLAVGLGLGRAVVPPSAVGDPDEDTAVPDTPVALGESGQSAMVSDPALADHLTGEGVIGAHRFLAELAITWLEQPSIERAMVVHLPPEADIDPDVVSLALGALADDQAARVVPLDHIFETVSPGEDGPAALPLVRHGVTGDLRPIAPALQSARSRVSGVGALLDDPLFSSALAQSLLVATGVDTPDAERRSYVENVDVALGNVSGAVTLPDEFRITLTSRSSTIPITVYNQAEQDLSVRIDLESDQLEFPEGTTLTEVLAPGTNRFEVPVRTRTSGAFTLVVTVASPDGTIELDSSSFDIRSTAISGVGLVLSIGAGLFLAVWWARHWRKARRSHALMPADDPTGAQRGVTAAHDAAEGPEAAPGAEAADAYRPAHMARSRTRSG